VIRAIKAATEMSRAGKAIFLTMHDNALVCYKFRAVRCRQYGGAFFMLHHVPRHGVAATLLDCLRIKSKGPSVSRALMQGAGRNGGRHLMTRPLSDDLRQPIISAVLDGESRRSADAKGLAFRRR
jgi:hypothetical protein